MADTTTVIAAVILLQLGCGSGNETLRWVAGSSDTAPTLSGEGNGAFRHRWIHHAVNGHGHVAFVTRINEFSPEEYGAFLSTQEGIEAIVRTDEPLPAEDLAPCFFRPAEVFLQDGGDVVVSGATGILLYRPSSECTWALASGMAAPGFGEDENIVISTDFFGQPVQADRGPIGKPAVNEQGKMAFRVVLEGPTITRDNRQALVAGTPGNLSTVMRQGEAVVENAVLQSFIWDRPEINPEGDLLMHCNLSPLGAASILIPHDGGEPRVVAHWSGPAPQLGELPRFRLSRLLDGGVGRNGWVWFSSQVMERGEGESIQFSNALWAGPAGAPQLILRTGTPVDAKGFEEGTVHNDFHSVIISSKNEVAFNGMVELPGDRFQGVRWLWQKGELRALNATAISEGNKPSLPFQSHFSKDGILWWNRNSHIMTSAPGRLLLYSSLNLPLPLPNGDTQFGDVEFLATTEQSNGINGISPSMARSGWCVFSAVFTRDFKGSGSYVVRVPYPGYAGWTITGELYSDWDPRGFTLKAPTNFGEWYQFERSVDMKTWMRLGPPILGDGTEQSALDESLPGLQGYYRFRLLK